MFSSLYIIHLESYLIDFPPQPAGFVLYINIQIVTFIILFKKNLSSRPSIFADY